jgi:uncharacterized protein with PIN domain
MTIKKNSASSILADTPATESSVAEKVAAPAVVSDEAPVNLTGAQLKDLLRTVISQTQEQASTQTKALVEAILESRKPYIDPKREENEKRWRAQMRKQREMMDANLKADQNRCEHIMGSNALSEYPDLHNRSSIIKHVLDTGEIIGMCTNCNKVWWPGDADYYTELRRHTTNKMSSAGRRFSVQVQQALEHRMAKEAAEKRKTNA